MKSVRFAYTVFTLLLILAVINSIALGKIIDRFNRELAAAEETNMILAEKQYSEIYEKYKELELYISLSVNHDDLSNLENAFAEIIGAAKAGDSEAVIITKNRLTDFLSHIRRLTGINFDSIF